MTREWIPIDVPTLQQALRRLTREQEEDTEIAMDMAKQGEKNR